MLGESTVLEAGRLVLSHLRPFVLQYMKATSPSTFGEKLGSLMSVAISVTVHHTIIVGECRGG